MADKEYTNDLAQRLQRLEDQINGSKHIMNSGDNTMTELPHDYVTLKRKIVANPAPLGLFAFGLTTALLQGATTTLTEFNVEHLTYCYALFYGGLVQLLAGMWEFPRGNMFGSVAFSSYGGFWLGWGVFGILTNAKILVGPLPEGVQMMLCLWGIFTFCMFIQTFTMNRCLQALFLSLTITFFVLAGGVKNHTCNKVGGYFGFLTAAIAFYTGLAELTNEVYKKPALPLFDVNKERVPVLPLVRNPTNIV